MARKFDAARVRAVRNPGRVDLIFPFIGQDRAGIRPVAVAVVLFMFLTAYIGFPIWVQLFTGYDEEIYVERAPVLRTCSDLQTRRFERHRTGTLPPQALGYCGHIEADIGAYKLPRTGEILTLAASREELYDTLKEGCAFKVKVSGFGQRPERGQPVRVPLRKTIINVLASKGCSSD